MLSTVIQALTKCLDIVGKEQYYWRDGAMGCRRLAAGLHRWEEEPRTVGSHSEMPLRLRGLKRGRDRIGSTGMTQVGVRPGKVLLSSEDSFPFRKGILRLEMNGLWEIKGKGCAGFGLFFL